MKALYLMMCATVLAGCCSCAEREIKETDDEVIARRLTEDWKRMVESELDAQKGDYLQLARYVRQTVHLHQWLLEKRDKALPGHKALYQEIIDHLAE